MRVIRARLFTFFYILLHTKPLISGCFNFLIRIFYPAFHSSSAFVERFAFVYPICWSLDGFPLNTEFAKSFICRNRKTYDLVIKLNIAIINDFYSYILIAAEN